MLKQIFDFLLNLSPDPQIEEYVRVEYPNDYIRLKAEGVKDMRPFLENRQED